MKKVSKSLLIILIFTLSIILTGCTKTISLIYKVETGDNIKVEMKTNDNYKLSTKVPFEISLDGDVLSTGTFLKEEGYDMYKSEIDSQSNVKIIEKDTKGDMNYIFFTDGKEYSYLIKIKDSKTGLYLKNTNSQDEAEKVFKLLDIKLA